jgi:glutamyl/glutaminyl-tRNA synthetase
MPIRVAISGKTQTPPLFPMLAALGRERSLARLRDAIALLTHGTD